MKHFETTNPWTGQKIERLSFTSPDELALILDRATQAFHSWKRSSSWERAQLLNQVAQTLQSQKSVFAQLISQEVGKPISFAMAEVDRGIEVLQWAAGEAQRFSGELIRLDAVSNGRAGFGIHTRFPRGVILGITPYNFPLNLMLHKIAPALATGCSIVIKPSLFAPLTALKLAQLFQEAIPHLVQIILATDEQAAQLTSSHSIAYISFTGSPAVGHQIQKQAPHQPITLELGGNAWVILCEDVPRELFPAIAQKIASAGFGYAGQSCISVQNIAIAHSIHDDFASCLRKTTESVCFGDPASNRVISGPVIHAQAGQRILDALAQVPDQLEVIRSHCPQGKIDGNPTIIPPTLYMHSKLNLSVPLFSAAQEEIFGPIMFAHSFSKLTEVIQSVNSSLYGLQAGVYTHNWSTIETLYRELEVGGLVVNDVPTTRYDHQPYGGVKASGVGREGLKYAMDEMTHSKFLALSSKMIGIS